MLLSLVCLMAPVSGPIVSGYGPVGDYGGHWGVDLATEPGTSVRAPISGVVSFAGAVAGMRTVTVTAADLKVSVSYLSEVDVAVGQAVRAGEVVGRSGLAHGTEAVHLSVRVLGRYVNPVPFLSCRFGSISQALRLVPYPGSGAYRTSRWNLRPSSSRPPPYGRGGLPSTGAGAGALRPGRSSLAEGRQKTFASPTSLGNDQIGGGRCRLF